MPSRVTAQHFALLRTFGKNHLQKNATPEMKEQLWSMVCQHAGQPYVPHTIVIEEWKKFIQAMATNSRLAINGDVNPGFVSVGITYKRRMVAAHTTKTKSLLRRLLKIYARVFPKKEAFLTAMEEMCRETVGLKAKEEEAEDE